MEKTTMDFKNLLNLPTQLFSYKDQLLEYIQLEGVVSRAEVLVSGDCQLIKAQAVINPDVTWQEAKKFYNFLPRKDQAQVRKSGQQLQQGWYNPVTGELDAPGRKPTDERGILVCQMYLQQGATCAYSGDGPCHILDFQVEHIISENGDYPDNIVLVLANVNENKKQNLVSFVNRAEKNLLKGQKVYEREINKKRQNSVSRKGLKEEIELMSKEELKAYVKENGPNKYVWRAVGMSSLGEFRILKNSGQRRAGGSQGNYKGVLDTIAQEFLFGDEEVSKDIFSVCRLLTSEYREGRIQNDVYAREIVSIIETSNNTSSNFSSEKLFNQIVRSSYQWPHL